MTTANYDVAYDEFRDYHDTSTFPLFQLDAPNKDVWEDADLDDFRNDEYGGFSVDEDGVTAQVLYDKRWLSKVDAMINICRTFMVCCLLGFSSYYFNRDSRRLVLDPLERMMERIQLIAENPMALCGDDEQNEGVLAFGKKKKKKADGDNEA